MLTNEKRIEIAANLRDLALGYENIPSWSVIACGELPPPIDDVMHAVGLGRAVHASKICSRLADLIEPEPERTCSVKEHAGSRGGRWVWFYTFSCGHEFESYWYMHPKYCPFCGAKVVEDAD